MYDDTFEFITIAIFFFIAPLFSICVSSGVGCLIGAWAGFFTMAAFLLIYAAVLIIGYKREKEGR